MRRRRVLDRRAFAKPFARSRISIDDRFLQRVVPAIAATTPDMNLSTAPTDLAASFLRINGDLRRRNALTIAELAKKTSAEMLWKDAFQPLGNASVEAGFADNRTYVYLGEEIDRQVHLGFDLAVTQRIPVLAANTGVVVYAADLGIYGNCVIVDHGLGVQSLYAHLSSIDVKEGDAGRERTRARSQRHDRPGRRRSPALHDARQRPAGESRGVVGSEVDAGPGPAEGRRSGRGRRVIIGRLRDVAR